MKTIVVSAVNVRKGGTLSILKGCLKYLSDKAAGQDGGLRIIALVHNKDLCLFPGIEYIELPWTIKSWARRLWCEYVTMWRISRRLADEIGEPVDVWLSMHDTTPRVLAKTRELYCQTSFPFMKRSLRDLRMDPKIYLFSLFTRFAYRINIHKNDNIIVQQYWFRDAMSKMLNVPPDKFRVITPEVPAGPSMPEVSAAEPALPTFFYASTADCHKNFETLFEAARLLENKLGTGKFKVSATISGRENRYSAWLFKHWGGVESIEFAGFLPSSELYDRYRTASCFVFPSRIETWGLPMTEFMSVSDRPMILANLPYAHETFSSGRGAEGREVSFFPATDASALAEMMEQYITVEK